MILRIASSRIVGQGDIVGRSGYFSLNLSANSVMRGRLDARRTLKSLVADLRLITYPSSLPIEKDVYGSVLKINYILILSKKINLLSGIVLMVSHLTKFYSHTKNNLIRITSI